MLLLTSDTLTACKPSVKIHITTEKDIYIINDTLTFNISLQIKPRPWSRNIVLEATFPNPETPVELERICKNKYRYTTQLTELGKNTLTVKAFFVPRGLLIALERLQHRIDYLKSLLDETTNPRRRRYIEKMIEILGGVVERLWSRIHRCHKLLAVSSKAVYSVKRGLNVEIQNVAAVFNPNLLQVRLADEVPEGGLFRYTVFRKPRYAVANFEYPTPTDTVGGFYEDERLYVKNWTPAQTVLFRGKRCGRYRIGVLYRVNDEWFGQEKEIELRYVWRIELKVLRGGELHSPPFLAREGEGEQFAVKAFDCCGRDLGLLDSSEVHFSVFDYETPADEDVGDYEEILVFGSPDHDAVGKVNAEKLAKKHRPVLKMHPKEFSKWGSVPVKEMVKRATLTNPETKEAGTYELGDLYDDYNSEDYYLDLPDKDQQFSNWKEEDGLVYRKLLFIGKSYLIIQYWFFYLSSKFPYFVKVSGDPPFEVEVIIPPIIHCHEGDWEMAQIAFKVEKTEMGITIKPFAMTASQHYYGQTIRWEPKDGQVGEDYVEKDKQDPNRPVLYIANGAHATYFKEGKIKVDTSILIGYVLLRLRLRICLMRRVILVMR